MHERDTIIRHENAITIITGIDCNEKKCQNKVMIR